MKNAARCRFGNEVRKRLDMEQKATGGMTQKELARLAGVTPAEVSYVIRGIRHPTLNTALKIAKVLGIKLDSLQGSRS